MRVFPHTPLHAQHQVFLHECAVAVIVVVVELLSVNHKNIFSVLSCMQVFLLISLYCVTNMIKILSWKFAILQFT